MSSQNLEFICHTTNCGGIPKSEVTGTEGLITQLTAVGNAILITEIYLDVEKLPSAKVNVTMNGCSRQINMITDSWDGRDETPRILVRISKDTQFDITNKWK